MRPFSALLVAATIAAFSSVLLAAPLPEELKPPRRMAPTFLPVVAAGRFQEGGEVTAESYVEVNVPIEVTRTVEKDGKQIAVKAIEYQTTFRAETRKFRLDSYKLFTADGKALPPKEVSRRIVPGAVLLVAWDGELPEPAYRKLLKQDTVILVARVKPGEPGGAVFPPQSTEGPRTPGKNKEPKE
jgi:hypothetical protein